MTLDDLRKIIEETSEWRGDTTLVLLEVEVESGFYDVPARHARGKLRGYEFQRGQGQIILRGK